MSNTLTKDTLTITRAPVDMYISANGKAHETEKSALASNLCDALRGSPISINDYVDIAFTLSDPEKRGAVVSALRRCGLLP